MTYFVVTKIKSNMSETGARVGYFRAALEWKTPYKTREEAEKAKEHLETYQPEHTHTIV